MWSNYYCYYKLSIVIFGINKLINLKENYCAFVKLICQGCHRAQGKQKSSLSDQNVAWVRPEFFGCFYRMLTKFF